MKGIITISGDPARGDGGCIGGVIVVRRLTSLPCLLVALIQVCVVLVDSLEAVNPVMIGMELPMC